MRVGAALVVTLGCSSPGEPPPPQPPSLLAPDAGAPGITEIGSADPALLDPEPRSPRASVARARPRTGRPIEIILKSTPPGATAFVDGIELGVTPQYWSGEANGVPHEFTFAKPKFGTARYRFVPLQSGIVHARLAPVIDEPPRAPGNPRRPATPPSAAPPAAAPPPAAPPESASPAPPIASPEDAGAAATAPGDAPTDSQPRD